MLLGDMIVFRAISVVISGCSSGVDANDFGLFRLLYSPDDDDRENYEDGYDYDGKDVFIQ